MPSTTGVSLWAIVPEREWSTPTRIGGPVGAATAGVAGTSAFDVSPASSRPPRLPRTNPAIATRQATAARATARIGREE